LTAKVKSRAKKLVRSAKAAVESVTAELPYYHRSNSFKSYFS